MRRDPAGALSASEVTDVFMEARSHLRDLDAQLGEIHLPDLSEVHVAWMIVASVELALSHGSTYPARAEEYGAELRMAIEAGLAQSGVQVARAWQVRQEFKNRLEACFDDVDVVLSPVFPGRLGLDVNLLDEQTFKGAARAIRLATPFSVSGAPSCSPSCFSPGSPPRGTNS